MTKQIDIGDKLALFLCSDEMMGNAVHVEVYKGIKRIQPILRFDNPTTLCYTLFKWRDEGYLPSSIKTIGDYNDEEDRRLIIVGVDEL